VSPRARDRGQARERPVGDRRAQVALRADAGANERRLPFGELAAEAADRLGLDAAELGAPLHRVLLEPLEQLVVADGVRTAPLLVGEARVDHRAHHPEGEGAVGARERANVLVRDAGRPRAVGVDRDEPGAVPACGEQESPEVRGRRHRIPAPQEDEARARPLLRIDLGRFAVGRADARGAGARADRPAQVRRSDRVHEARAHPVGLQDALGPEVAVRKDRLRPVPLDHGAEPGRDGVERLVP
jgi:hypothetical protein